MTRKHTPGPWRLEPSWLETDNPYVVADNGKIFPYVEFVADVALEADARLIAAAPDLLAACEKAMIECCDLIGTEAGIALEAAIAKAKGETT